MGIHKFQLRRSSSHGKIKHLIKKISLTKSANRLGTTPQKPLAHYQIHFKILIGAGYPDGISRVLEQVCYPVLFFGFCWSLGAGIMAINRLKKGPHVGPTRT